MNKLIMSLIAKFMSENEDNIIEFITHPEGELAQKWIEQGNAVKEHLGVKDKESDKNEYRC